MIRIKPRKKYIKQKVWVAIILYPNYDMELGVFDNEDMALDAIEDVYDSLTSEKRNDVRFLITEKEVHTKGE